MILEDFVFFNSSSTSTTSETYKVHPEASEVVLQLSGTVTGVTVEIMTDLDANTWAGVSMISLADMMKKDTVSAAGTYTVPASGIKRMRVKHTGSAGALKAYAVATN